MEGMRKGLDVEKAEVALKRAADKATFGTLEERSGRFQAAKRRDPAPPPRAPKQSNLGHRKA
jgi:hypothetical protein